MGRQRILVVLCMNSGKHIIQIKSQFYFLIVCSIVKITYCLVFFIHKSRAAFMWLQCAGAGRSSLTCSPSRQCWLLAEETQFSSCDISSCNSQLEWPYYMPFGTVLHDGQEEAASLSRTRPWISVTSFLLHCVGQSTSSDQPRFKGMEKQTPPIEGGCAKGNTYYRDGRNLSPLSSLSLGVCIEGQVTPIEDIS